MGSEIYGGPNRALAAAKVNAPAIALMVVGGLGILWHLLSLGLNLLGTSLSLPGMMADQDAAQRAIQAMSGGVGLVFSALGLGLSGLVIFGAMKMRALTGYGLAMASAILAMVPGFTCWCCCFGLPGLPFGIWALVVLLDNNVKASFV
jgi:hypothetical protein